MIPGGLLRSKRWALLVPALLGFSSLAYAQSEESPVPGSDTSESPSDEAEPGENAPPSVEAGSSPESGGAEVEVAVSAARREAELRGAAGQLAMEQGRFDAARSDFVRAYEVDPSPERLWQLCQALSALRREGELVAAYRAYLAAGGPRGAEVRARLAVVERVRARRRVPPPERQDADDVRGPDSSDQDEEEEGGSITDEPWFWIAAAVLVGGGVLAALLLGSDGGTQEPLAGDEGVVVHALVSW